MKFKFVIITILAILFLFASCAEEKVEETKQENEAAPSESSSDEQAAAEVEEEEVEEVVETKKAVEFNVGLTDYEDRWRQYLQDQNQDTKIYHIKSNEQPCDGCYTLYYKKDRTIIKMKIIDDVLQQQTNIKDDLATEIENEDVCTLFSGTWNNCPKVCTTDEEACDTQCGLPVCEFTEAVEFKGAGEVCGGVEGDCIYGYSCKYEDSLNDETGICERSLR